MEDIKILTQAILSLKQETNYFKDYIFPIAIAFFSSFIGALLAYFVFHRQERIVAEKLKLDTVNKWFLLGDELHQSLIAIKFNYYNQLNSDPYQRVFAVPSILLNEENYRFDYHELVFISDVNGKKWSNIPYLRTLFSNYSSLISIWKTRNNLNEKVRSQIMKANDKNITYIDLVDSQIEVFANQSDLATLIDLTETALRLTDDLIIEFHNFLNEFPNTVKDKIKLNLIKNYGFVLRYDSSNNESIKSILKVTPLPNYAKLSIILGRSEEELMARYSSLFHE